MHRCTWSKSIASTSLLEALVWDYFSGKDVSVMKDGDDYFPEIDPWVLEKKEIDPGNYRPSKWSSNS